MKEYKLIISNNPPRIRYAVWAKPVSGGFSLYLNVGGSWKPFKQIDDKGTSAISDDIVQDLIGSVSDEKNADTIYGAKAAAQFEAQKVGSLVESNSASSLAALAKIVCGGETLVIPAEKKVLTANSYGSESTFKTAIIPVSVTEIQEQAFNQCASLETVYVQSNTLIRGNAFSGCSNLKIVHCADASVITTNYGSISSGIKTLFGTQVVEFYIECNNIGVVGSFAFQGCVNLKDLLVPEGVTLIESKAFDSCSSLVSLTLPSTLATFGAHPFGDSASSVPNLSKLTILATTPPTCGPGAETLVIPTTTDIYVPSSSVDTYKAHSHWSAYAEQIQAIPSN